MQSSFENNNNTSKRSHSCNSCESLMTIHDDESSTVGSQGVVVAYPDVDSSREARSIGRLKLALEIVSLGLLVMTVLFIWQVTKKNGASEQKPTVDPLKNQEYLTFKASPCPIMMEKTEPPWLLPDQVKQYLPQTDFTFSSFGGLDGLVSMAGNVVYQDRVVWKKSYGVKDKKHKGSLPDQNTVFRVASISKIFTVLFVFKLLESGQIDCLDDSLEQYEPRFQVKNPFNQQKITIRQILSHTSGLPREVPCGNSYSYSTTHLCPVNNTYVLQQLKNTELKSPPGKLPHYSNLGYALIARLLAEKFANNDFEGWVQRNILIPLGMRNTGFRLERMSSNKAFGYFDDHEAPLVDWDWAAPAIQAYSTPNDLYKKAPAVFSHCTREDVIFPTAYGPPEGDALMTQLFGTSTTKILKKDLLHQLMKPDFMYPDGKTVFGTGWEIKDVGTYSVLMKTGFIPGYSSGFAFVPEFKLGAVVLVSGREFAGSAALSIVETLAKVMDTVLLRQQLQIDIVPNTKQYIGEYTIVSRWIPEVIVNITEDNGLLLFTQTPGSLGFSYLKPIKGHEFEVIYRPGLECVVYGMGQNRERVIFDPPSASGKSVGLKFGPFIFKRTSPNQALKAEPSNLKLTPSGLL